MAFFDFFKKIKVAENRRRPQATDVRQEQPEDFYCEALDQIKIREDIALEPTEAEIWPGPDDGSAEQSAAQGSKITLEDIQEPETAELPAEPEPANAAPAPELRVGGIYALQGEQQGAPLRLTKLVHHEDGIVHLLCYAQRCLQAPADLDEAGLTAGVDEADGSFGAEHLPMPEQSFAAKSTFVQQSALLESDVRGCRLFLESVSECLDESAPEWLRKAASHAVWRNDPNAMAALADCCLVGADLPRDSRKALYWLNRIVQQSIGVLPPGESVRTAEHILSGGIYARMAQDGSCIICKVVLKDRHGVQQLIFPAVFAQLPAETNPVRLLAQARGSGFVHDSTDAEKFLAGKIVYLGLLPITADEIHCYRTYLLSKLADADLQPSAFELLRQQAEAGSAEAQHELAQLYLAGDPAWELQRNLPEAIRWFTQASNLGHGLAAYTLAVICREGAECVTADPKLSFEWLLYASQLDCGLAQLHAADCCRHGSGCAQDLPLAHAWYAVAASRSNGLSTEEKKRAERGRKEVEAELSAEQLAAARECFRQIQESF